MSGCARLRQLSHIPRQNQALLHLVPGPGERYLSLQSGLTLMGDHGDPLAWGKIAGWGHGVCITGKSAEWSAVILYAYNSGCCDSVCKCTYSLGGDWLCQAFLLGTVQFPPMRMVSQGNCCCPTEGLLCCPLGFTGSCKD